MHKSTLQLVSTVSQLRLAQRTSHVCRWQHSSHHSWCTAALIRLHARMHKPARERIPVRRTVPHRPYIEFLPAKANDSNTFVPIANMSVPEFVRRKYSTMFTTHPPFAYEHTDDSILARLRCDPPPTMAYKEQPIHSCAAERTRRFSLPAPERMAVDSRPFSPPKRSRTAPSEAIHSDGELTKPLSSKFNLMNY